MELLDEIVFEDKILAYIIPGNARPLKTTFLTPPEHRQQVGFVVYPSGGTIPRHVHKQVKREIYGTAETLLVRAGVCEVDIYNDFRALVATRTLRAGDVLVLVAGGHGFRVLEDTVLLEVKQGPYVDADDKVKF